VDDGITLVGVIKTNQEVFRLVARNQNVPVREAELSVQLVSYGLHALLRTWVEGDGHYRLAAQLLELRGHGTTGDIRGAALSWPLKRKASHDASTVDHGRSRFRAYHNGVREVWKGETDVD
jgi:hypothetical protein